MFISDIKWFFIKEGQQNNLVNKIEMLLFADDTTILSSNLIDLQDNLKALHKYCENKKLKVNSTKTEIVVFSKGGSAKKLNKISYDNPVLNVVKQNKVLGVMFASSGSFKKEVDFTLCKGNTALGSI